MSSALSDVSADNKKRGDRDGLPLKLSVIRPIGIAPILKHFYVLEFGVLLHNKSCHIEGVCLYYVGAFSVPTFVL